MRKLSAFLGVLVLLVPLAARADWPASGLVLSQGRRFSDVRIQPDGVGGLATFFTTYGQISGLTYARSVSMSGVAGSANFGYAGLRLASDGAGGYHVVTFGASGLVVLHTDANGQLDPAWPLAGAPLPAGTATWPALAPDGSGGVYVACATPVATLVRLDASGAVVAGWPAAGLVLDSGAPTAENTTPALVVDALHRATVLFYDHANALDTRRVLPDGTFDPAWTGGEFGAYTFPGSEVGVRGLVSSGSSLYAYWADAAHARIARLDAAGAVAAGWPVMAASGSDESGGGPNGPWSQDTGRISAFGDASGGLYLFCMPGTAPDTVVATHVGPGGTALGGWSLPGAPVTLPGAPDPVRASMFAAVDGTGGAFYGWNSALTRLLSNGNIAPGWSGAGDMVAPDSTMRITGSCAANSVQLSPITAMGDGTGAALLMFGVRDCGTFQALRLARFLPAGAAGVPPLATRAPLSVRLLGPNPAAGVRRFALAADVAAPATFEVLDVTGRVVSRAFVATGSASGERTWSPSSNTHAGVYFARLTQRGVSRAARFVVLD